MQVGNAYVSPNGTTITVCEVDHDICKVDIAYADGLVLRDTFSVVAEKYWLSIGYTKYEPDTKPDTMTGKMSCTYESPRTPVEEEEDYRKKRDAIFARMFS